MKSNPYRKDQVERISKINDLEIHNMEENEDILTAEVAVENQQEALAVKDMERDHDLKKICRIEEEKRDRR